MPPALKALLAQFGGVAAAAALARSGLLSGLPALVGAQALAATAVAAALGSARWWLPIHLAFMPAAFALHEAALPPALYLGAFVLSVLVYWSSFRTQVPLYLSNAATAHAVAGLLPQRACRVLDVGAGTGSLLRTLCRLRPDAHFSGIEIAPAPWLLGRLLQPASGRLEWHRGDLFARSWANCDVVYAFLSPVPMARIWEKARAEMPAHGLLLCNSFPVPGVQADFVVDVGDRRGTRLYGYRLAGDARRGGGSAGGDDPPK